MGADHSVVNSIVDIRNEILLTALIPGEIREKMKAHQKWFAEKHVEWREKVIKVFNLLKIKYQMQLRSTAPTIINGLKEAVWKERGSLLFHCKIPTIEELEPMIQDEAGIRELLKEITRCLFLDYEIFKYEIYVDKLVDGIHVEIIDNIWTARPDENYRIGGRRHSVKGGRKGKSKKNVSKRYKKKARASRRNK
jgi:hypothetical protein